jgi:hypothetical protein
MRPMNTPNFLELTASQRPKHQGIGPSGFGPRHYAGSVSRKGHLRPLLVLALVHSLCLVVPCAAQGIHKPERESETDRPVSGAHSFMELFTKLERDWTEALQKKDKTALDAILAPEFMLWNSDNPENPLSRADWIQHELTSCEALSSSHRGITIRAFSGVAVVSFVESRQRAIGRKDCSGEYFIVDVWEANHDKWQASARYASPLNNHLVSGTKGRK